MIPSQRRPKTCHNCRRRRLKCDGSFPHCLKCIKRGQECLGYQRLFRWEQGVASRGKMAGMTFEKMTRDQARHEDLSLQSASPVSLLSQQSSRGDSRVSPSECLTDPLVQHLDHASRKYLIYFAGSVCRDLVLYDVPKHNPFHELIPLAGTHPVLLQIIIATSALHMSNAFQESLPLDTTGLPVRHGAGRISSSRSDGSVIQSRKAYHDALAAKQRALYSLKSALTSTASVDIDVTLAVVLLFIELELIDSRRDDWTYHINGARAIIETLCGLNVSTQANISPLRSCLISNCLVYDIIGSTFATSISVAPDNVLSTSTLSLLQDAEGNHCASFPVPLLRLIQAGAHLAHSNHAASTDSKGQQALLLLHTAQSFDPISWAKILQSRSPVSDLQNRIHIASAHRAAACIYLSRILLSVHPTAELPYELGFLVSEVVTHLLFTWPNDALFTATAWPTFVAGAETNDLVTQQWVTARFQELWKVQPWGLIRGALGVLERIWADRKSKEGTALEKDRGSGGWIQDLRGRGVDWLII